MVLLNFQSPIDQPKGNNRLIDILSTNLDDPKFDTFQIIVAFAKVAVLEKLQDRIVSWRDSGKSINAIFGIDHHGTSKEALKFALDNFDEVRVFHTPRKYAQTFHPKLYMFTGPDVCDVYIGSNNLTVGGMETNFESGVRLSLSLPDDNKFYSQLISVRDALIDTKNARLLTDELLGLLENQDMVLSESEMRVRSANTSPSPTESLPTSATSSPLFPDFEFVPPDYRPRHRAASAESVGDSLPTEGEISRARERLIMQINPHKNGEILLSKKALDQNNDFFGYPFSGWTTPKHSRNRAYPQRLPDPLVNIALYDENDTLVWRRNNYELNMVFYVAKKDVRITVPKNIVDSAPKNSLLIMTLQAETATYDYDIDIYVPTARLDSKYQENLSLCDQEMNRGSLPVGRKFGWVSL